MNNDNKPKVSVHAIGFLDVLGIAFIVLKLLHIIDWSWWLVLLPIYGPFVLITILLIIAIIAYGSNNYN